MIDNIRSQPMTGKTVVVTGATGGIGRGNRPRTGPSTTTARLAAHRRPADSPGAARRSWPTDVVTFPPSYFRSPDLSGADFSGFPLPMGRRRAGNWAGASVTGGVPARRTQGAPAAMADAPVVNDQTS